MKASNTYNSYSVSVKHKGSTLSLLSGTQFFAREQELS